MKFEDKGSYQTVKCEVCGDDNGLHIRAVRINRLGRVLSVAPAGVQEFTVKQARGSIVEVDFWCEFGGHQFTVRFEFHKGQVLHTVDILPVMTQLSADERWPESELPRD